MKFRRDIHLVLLVWCAAALLLAACGGGALSAPSTAPAAAQASTAPAAAQPTAASAAAQPATPATAAPTKAPAAATAAATKAPTKVPTAAPTAAPTAVPTAVLTEAPAAPSGSAALDLLGNALRAQMAQKAWRSTVTNDDAGKVTTTVLERVAPDSLHMITGDGQEIIVLKEGSYQKAAGGAWQKLPMDMGAIMTQVLDPTNVEELLEGITVDEVKFLGPALLDGRPMWTYRYVSRMELAGQSITTEAKIWIGVLDKLPYRGESESDSILNPGARTKSVTVYEYDPNLTIEAPIK